MKRPINNLLIILNFSLFTSLLTCSTFSYALFEDADARRAILEMREKLDNIEKRNEELSQQIEASRLGRLKLVNEIEQLNAELSKFRGFGEESEEINESLNNKIELLESTVENLINRISILEPEKVTVAGREILVGNIEKELYEEASEMMANGNYSAAIQLFEKFNKKFLDSSLTAYALHSKGLAYYALQAHKSAITTLKKIETDHLSYPKLADAMLTLAASQTEIGRVKDAIKTLESLIQKAPSSDAALTARERIKKLKPNKS